MAFNIFKTALKGFEKLKDGVEDIASPFSVLKTKKNPTIANNIISTIATIQKAKKAAPVVLSNAQKLSNDIRTVKPFLKKGVDKLQSPNAQMFETVINALTPISSNFTGRTGIQTPTKGERFISKVADVTAPATRMNQNILRGISKAPSATKDFLLPTRGYSESDIFNAKPSIKEGLAGGAKLAGEIGNLFPLAVGYTATQLSKLGNDDEQYQANIQQGFNNYAQKSNEFLAPNSAGEAKAMRIGDILSFAGAGITKNVGKNLAKATTKEEVKSIAAKTGIGMTDDMAVQIAKTSSESKIRGILDQGRDVIKLISDELKTNGKNVDLTQANKSLPETLPIFKKEAGGSQKNTGSYQKKEKAKDEQSTSKESLSKKLASNIRLDKLGIKTETAEKELKRILDDADNFSTQRRGVQTFEMTEEAADRILPKLKLKPGTTLNAEEKFALGNVVKGYSDEIDSLAQRIKMGENDDINLLQLAKLRTDYQIALASLSGAKAEAGRALSAERMINKLLVDPRIRQDEKMLKEALKMSGGREGVKQIAKRLGEFGDDTIAKYKFIQKLSQPIKSEKFNNFVDWWWYNSLLSGPKTQIRNTLGNGFHIGFNLLSKPIAGAVDATKSRVYRLAGKKRAREVYAGELPSEIKGVLTGIPEGFRKAKFMWDNGFSLDDLVQSEFAKPEMFTKIFDGKLAKPLNAVSRAMQGTDQFFRTIVANSELHALAYKNAKNKGLKGDAYKKAVNEYIDNPPMEAIEAMRKAAEEATFQNPNKVASGVDRLLSRNWKMENGFEIFNPFKLIVPFIKTPANIIARSAEATPLGFFTGAARVSGRESSQVMGKSLLGSIGLASLWTYAQQGLITGSGPKDKEMRDALYATGWRPNSIKIGDKYYSYQLFAPMSQGLSFIGNLNDKNIYDGELPSVENIFWGMGSTLVDNSFLEGLEQLHQAMQYQDASYITKNVAGAAVPFSALSRTVAMGLDNKVRESNSSIDAMKANIPILREQLQVKPDLFGREIEYEGGALKRMLDPFNISTEKNDLESNFAREVIRLKVKIAIPDNKQKLTNIKTSEKITLDSKQKNEYAKSLGEMMRTTIDRSLFSPEYQNMSDDEKRVYLEERIADGKKFVDGVYFIESLTTEEKKQLGNKVVDYSIAVPTETKDLEAYDTLTGNKIDLSTEDKSVYYERIWRGIYDAINQGEQQKEFPLLDQQRKSDFINSQVGSVKSFMKDGFSILLSEGEEKFNHTLGIKLQSDSDEFLKNSLLDIGVEKILDFAKNDLPVDEFMQSSEMKMILEKVQTDEDMDRILKGVKNSLLAEGKSAYENFLSNQNTETKALYLYGDLLELSGDNKAIDKFIEKIPTYAQSGILDDATIEKVIELYTTKTLQEQEDVNNVVDEADNKPIWPTTSARISQQYGYGHTGLDIDGEFGDPVNAMLPGVVVSAQWGGPYGNFVVVDHGNGLVTRYAHLQKYGVQRGDQVKAGDFLGEQGSTGNSTGSHLHFEVLKDNKFVNPYEYVNF